MTIKKIKKSFTVWLVEDVENFFRGSFLCVEKESDKFYYGIQSSMNGSFFVKFPKNKCTKINPLKKNTL